MKSTIIFCLIALLAGCGEVAHLTAYSNGRCTSGTYSGANNPDSNIQILQSRDGSTVTCTIKFEVTK